jgi:hypothetical protein
MQTARFIHVDVYTRHLVSNLPDACVNAGPQSVYTGVYQLGRVSRLLLPSSQLRMRWRY